MALRIEPLSVEQDADDTFLRTFLQSNGVPIDFTGFTAKMKIRQTQDPSSSTILTLSTGSGLTLGGTAGTLSISLTSAQTLAMGFGTYYYDIMLIDGLGGQSFIMGGPFIVGATVTR